MQCWSHDKLEEHQRLGVQPVQPPKVAEYSAGSGPGSDPVQARFRCSGCSGCSGCSAGHSACSTCSGVQHVFSVFKGVQSVQGAQETVQRVFRRETKMIYEKRTQKKELRQKRYEKNAKNKFHRRLIKTPTTNLTKNLPKNLTRKSDTKGK